jgi:hypothetical protein
MAAELIKPNINSAHVSEGIIASRIFVILFLTTGEESNRKGS